MDQIKIGKFIADIRREQNMTQLDLANKIGVTDRAVSKWENGRGMPELSLIKPLCDALSISINELFCGERIEMENINEFAEENIISTLSYSQNKIKKTKVIFISVLTCIVVLIALFVTLFSIDISRMRNNEPVVFSTWGFDYAPPVDLKYEEIQLAIRDYLVEHGDMEEKHHQGVKTFVALHTYLIQEMDSQYSVYAWVLQEQCYVDKNDVMNYGSFSIPFKFIVKKQEDGYIIADSRYPRDGSYYDEDMKNLFPKSVLKEMNNVHKDGTIDKLQIQINEQVKLYFNEIYSNYQ